MAGLPGVLSCRLAALLSIITKCPSLVFYKLKFAVSARSFSVATIQKPENLRVTAFKSISWLGRIFVNENGDSFSKTIGDLKIVFCIVVYLKEIQRANKITLQLQ